VPVPGRDLVLDLGRHAERPTSSADAVNAGRQPSHLAPQGSAPSFKRFLTMYAPSYHVGTIERGQWRI